VAWKHDDGFDEIVQLSIFDRGTAESVRQETAEVISCIENR
jgi:hypothetical protein